MNYDDIFYDQKNYFNDHKTKNIENRKKVLTYIYKWISSKTSDIENALKEDLGKSSTESYMTEIGMTLDCVNYCLKNIDKWTKKNKVSTPLTQFFSKSYTIYEPYGVTLVMAPWNYPFLLSMEPLIYALAAGNTVILKPSEYAIHTSQLLKQLSDDINKNELVSVILGDERVSRNLLQYPFDYIFFTGSSNVGKAVYKKAAEHLTPVTLELGGKSPCIVCDDADIDIAAKRIAFGKVLNAGQTCVAPDYLFIEESIKDKFVHAYIKYINEFFENEPLHHPNYPKIINRKHFNRLLSLMDNTNIIYGGEYDERSLKISPTLIENVSDDDLIMNQEIFGPLLPIMTYTSLKEVINYINKHDKPLALYLFTEDKNIIDHINTYTSFGGGCINDTIMHLANRDLPFGGVGASGIGAYHGKYSFKTFSHKKSILHNSTKRDFEYRYHPYTKEKENLIKKYFK